MIRKPLSFIRDLRRPKEERGAIIVMFSSFMTGLVIFAALGVDVGLWHVVETNIQNAADASAMAGATVIGGGDPVAVTDAVKTTAAKNGYPDGPRYKVTWTTDNLPSSDQLRVDITDTNAPRVLSGMISKGAMSIHRYAIAESRAPMQMGSPKNAFGTGTLIPGEESENFWGNVGGKCAPTSIGDIRSSKYAGNERDLWSPATNKYVHEYSGCPENVYGNRANVDQAPTWKKTPLGDSVQPNYRTKDDPTTTLEDTPAGYTFIVKMPQGSSGSLYVYDAGVCNNYDTFMKSHYLTDASGFPIPDPAKPGSYLTNGMSPTQPWQHANDDPRTRFETQYTLYDTTDSESPLSTSNQTPAYKVSNADLKFSYLPASRAFQAVNGVPIAENNAQNLLGLSRWTKRYDAPNAAWVPGTYGITAPGQYVQLPGNIFTGNQPTYPTSNIDHRSDVQKNIGWVWGKEYGCQAWVKISGLSSGSSGSNGRTYQLNVHDVATKKGTPIPDYHGLFNTNLQLDDGCIVGGVPDAADDPYNDGSIDTGLCKTPWFNPYVDQYSSDKVNGKVKPDPERFRDNGRNHFSLIVSPSDADTLNDMTARGDLADAVCNSSEGDTTCPQVYGLSEISMVNQSNGTLSDYAIHMTQLSPTYSGRTLRLSAQDLADGADFIQIIAPNGKSVPFKWTSPDGGDGTNGDTYMVSWTPFDSNPGSPIPNDACLSGVKSKTGDRPCFSTHYGTGAKAGCQRIASAKYNNYSEFDPAGYPAKSRGAQYSNERIINFSIPLTADMWVGTNYEPGNNWFKIRYESALGTGGDHVTWSASVSGDPVRLVG